MMDRQHGKFVFECDSCDDTLETDTRDWEAAKKCLDREGWKARRIGVDWVHGCPKHARTT